MQDITRRSALTGIAYLSAIGVTQAAAKPAVTGTHPDALLLSLGREYDALKDAYVEQWWIQERLLDDEAEANPPPDEKSGSREEWYAYLDRHRANLSNFDDDIKLTNDLCEAMDSIAERIRSIEPKTAAGLAVWGRCLIATCMNPQEATAASRDMDWGHLQIRDLVMQVERMAAKEARS